MKTSNYESTEMVVSLTGTSFEPAQSNVVKFGCEDIGSYELVREPANPYDRNAISVRIADRHLGYIPAYCNKSLAHKMDAGKKLSAFFSRRKDGVKNGCVGLEIKIKDREVEL